MLPYMRIGDGPQSDLRFFAQYTTQIQDVYGTCVAIANVFAHGNVQP